MSLRRDGASPQDVPAEIAEPAIQHILEMPTESFLALGPVEDRSFERKPGVFDAEPCDGCGEMTFIDKLESTDGKRYCPACRK